MNNTFKSNSNSNQLNSADEQRTILQSATQLNTSMNMVTENELQVLQSDTINPTLEPQTLSTQSTIIKKSSKKCPFGDCSDKPVKIIGECRYCTLKYCSRHRLPEAHLCENLVNCRLDASNRLSTKLLGEKCVASKV